MPGRKIYPGDKEKLKKSLSANDLEIIQKDYPYKHIRDAKIHEIMHGGVSCHVLAELTGGLSKSAVHRIGQLGVNRNFSENEQNLKNKLIKIKAAVDKFYSEINEILKR